MNTVPKVCVSIIVPVYDTEKYLATCLDSLMNQTLLEIEVICVNDGSKDRSLAILHEYAEKDKRFKVIDKRNEGQAVARNLALSLACGRYIAFVDSDDHVDKDLCRKAFDFCERHQCDMVIYDFVRFEDQSNICNECKEPSSLSAVSPLNKRAMLEHHGVVWTKFVRADFISSNHITFPEGLIYEDMLVHWQFILLAQNIGILPERLYHYRILSSATTCRTDCAILDRVLIFDLIRNFLVSHDLFEMYGDLFLRFQLNSFWWIYDTVDASHKETVLALVKDRLREEHWAYVASKGPLHRRARGFYQMIHGSRLAKIWCSLWFCARSCFRILQRKSQLQLIMIFSFSIAAMY